MPAMIPFRHAALFVLFTTLALARAPENVAGDLFARSLSMDRISSKSEILLNADGSYTGLFSTYNATIPPAIHTTKIPPNGTWRYRKLDDNTGQLTLDGSAITLSFDSSGTAGQIPEDTRPLLSDGRFELKAYEAATPLMNCSNRSFVRAGSSAFTGFVINSSSRGRVLVRAVGPGLAAFGVTAALRDPTLKVRQAREGFPALTESNDNWDSNSADGVTAANRLVGAFPLVEKSKDSALILSLSPGAYIAEVSSPDSTDTGEVLIEVYVLP